MQRLFRQFLYRKQEVLGKINRLLSFDRTLTTEKQQQQQQQQNMWDKRTTDRHAESKMIS
jgi:hypothetical protein